MPVDDGVLPAVMALPVPGGVPPVPDGGVLPVPPGVPPGAPADAGAGGGVGAGNPVVVPVAAAGAENVGAVICAGGAVANPVVDGSKFYVVNTSYACGKASRSNLVTFVNKLYQVPYISTIKVVQIGGIFFGMKIENIPFSK